MPISIEYIKPEWTGCFGGVIHLILYRYINYYVMIGPEEVSNTPELVRFIITNFALYLRISGQFHLIIGMLHLFGFNLPETHQLYFMASSFTDLWRRINIYWKDFMLKVFYYPTYFRIRHWGPNSSLIFATAFVFFLTWLFHAYQWFWLRGTFLFTAPDMIFWFILACLVVINTLYEARRGRKRTLAQRSMTFGDIASLALRTAGTYTVMAVLWSLWSSDSIRDWIALISVVEVSLQNIAYLLLFSFQKFLIENLCNQAVSFCVRVLIPVSYYEGLRVLVVICVGKIQDDET